MNKAFFTALLLVCTAAAQAPKQEPWLPALPDTQAVQSMPEQERSAATAAIKRVMLYRYIRMREERHRYTPENAAECVALAQKLGAPEVLVKLLQLEAEKELSGREQYECRQALQTLMYTYGVDILGMRLFVESLHYPADTLRRVVDALPMDVVFNLMPQEQPTKEEAELQLTTLADTYAQMVEVYSGIESREQAEAAVPRLMPLLFACNAALPLRRSLAQGSSASGLSSLYERLVEPRQRELHEHRIRLAQTMHYGSAMLAALDFLLN